MNRLKTSLLSSALLLAAVTLAGCGGTIFESKKIDYKTAGKLPSLEVPPDLTTPGRDERYVVPDVNSKGTATFSSYADERAQSRSGAVAEVLPDAGKLRIERAGTQRWLVVPGTPDKLWSGIKEFWQETGFTIALDLPEAGVMETDWVENRAKIPQDFIRKAIGSVLDSLYSTPERDKFRTRLEKGSVAGTTEIYISHRGMYEIYVTEGKSETRWQPRPADPELEAEMLQRIMVRLGADETRAKSLLAKEAVRENAKLARAGDGSGNLVVQESFDRAWRRVGLALDRVGFTVEDRDRSQGIYYVRYVDPDGDSAKEDKGIVSKLMFWKTDKSDFKPNSRFRIVVKGDGATSTVQVLTREGGVDNKSETANKILGLLFEQLK